MLEARKRRGLAAPALDSRPVLNAGLVDYWVAFRRLATEREIGVSGPGPIPVSAVCFYADRFGFDHRELVTIIEAMDEVYLRFCRQKGEQERAKLKARGGRKSKR